MNMKKIIIAFFLLFAHLQTNTLIAQDLLKGNDLSTVKVDNLSEADIAKVKTQLQANNTTIEQIEPMVLAKGMSATEFAKLKARIGATAATNANKKDAESSTGEFTRTQEKIINTKVKDSLNALGKDGWELVSAYETTETVHPNFGNSEYVTGLQPNVRTSEINLIFKRKK